MLAAEPRGVRPRLIPDMQTNKRTKRQVSTQPILPVDPIPTQKDRRTRELRRPSPNPLYPTAKPDLHLRPVGGLPRRCSGGRPARASPHIAIALAALAARSLLAPPLPIHHRVKAPTRVPGRHLTARLVSASGRQRSERWRRARRVNEPRRQAVPSRHVLELADASSGDMRLSDHAARSMI